MAIYLNYILILFFVIEHCNCILYDRFSGEKVNHTRIKEVQVANSTKICFINIKPCTPYEGSRVDGTCNNFNYPSLGSAKGPYARLLKPDYAEDGGMRRSKSSDPLPSARLVRTSLQSTGRVTDKTVFNVAAMHYLDFINKDISVLLKPVQYITEELDCCNYNKQRNPRCVPIEVPEDDPYLKVTGIRCLNFSLAETFQDVKCLSKSMLPEHINLQTPVIDLSTIYGVDENSLNRVRKWTNGLLVMDNKNGHDVPTANILDNLCVQNQGNETNCYNFGFPEVGNFDLRMTIFSIFFMREHNRLAKNLHELNPCWKDDRLFKVARQINIGTAVNIFMAELLPELLGQQNMLNYGLLSTNKQHISGYDSDALPLVFVEYEIAIRFFRTLIDGRIKKYDENYKYVGELSYSDYLLRQGILGQNDHFEQINRGTFYQNAAKIDDVQDPEISERYFGNLQIAHDSIASDIQRGRELGIRGYNDYRNICGLKVAKSFDDLTDVIDREKVEILKHLYSDVDDIDLLVGINSENFIKNTFVGPTLFCIIGRQMNVYRFGDRFWFERGNQFHSFNSQQLQEIRKTNLARFACDNAEGIKFVQPKAFLNMRIDNIPVSCSDISGMDLTRWRDENCYKDDANSKFNDMAARGIFDKSLSSYNNLFSIRSTQGFPGR